MCALIVNALIWYSSKWLHGYLSFGGISNNASINVWRLTENAFKRYYRHLKNTFIYWYWKAFWKNASKDLLSPVYRWHVQVCLKRFLKAFWWLLKAFLMPPTNSHAVVAKSLWCKLNSNNFSICSQYFWLISSVTQILFTFPLLLPVPEFDWDMFSHNSTLAVVVRHNQRLWFLGFYHAIELLDGRSESAQPVATSLHPLFRCCVCDSFLFASILHIDRK